MSSTRQQLTDLLREAHSRGDRENAEKLIQKINTTPPEQGGYGRMSTLDYAAQTGPTPVADKLTSSGFLVGFQDQAAGLAQLAARLAPDSRPPEVVLAGIPKTARRVDDYISRNELAYEKNREDRGDTGIDWARIGGNFASPISVASMGIPVSAATVPGRIAGATAMGGTMGASMPVTREGDFWSDKALQVAAGGAGGAAAGVAIPSAFWMLKNTVRGAKSLAQFLTNPFYQKGRMMDLTNSYHRLAGESRDWLYKTLADPDEFSQSGKYTAGQIIARANRKAGTAKGKAFVRQEFDLSKKPQTGDEMAGVLAEQRAGRLRAVNNILDISDEGLDAAIAKRKSATDPLYEKVRQSQERVVTRPVIDKVSKLLNEHPSETRATTPLTKVMNDMRWQGSDGNIYLETRVGPLYSLRQEIRSMMNRKTPGGDNEFDIAILGEVKDALDDALTKASPDFREATSKFKELSKPINEIKVIRYMGDALQSAIGNDTPSTYVNAMKNAPKTLKRATGFPRFKNLNQVLNKDQIKVLRQVEEELLDMAEYKRLSSATNSVYGEIEEGINKTLPNPLLRPVMVLNSMLRSIAKHYGADYEKLTTKLHKNPEMIVEIMKRPSEDKERQMLYDVITRTLAMIPARESAREINQ